MPRARVSHDLQPLPPRSGLANGSDKTRSLSQLLRSLAIKNQREQPRVFYPVREVAKQYRVPVSSVAKIYREMEHEGLLGRVRGSKTVLHGLQYDRRLSVRAFVALPAMMSAFITIRDYRMFLISIRQALWSHGFAATIAFYRPDEAADGSLCERLKAFGVDTVIWFSPGRVAKESLLRLGDMGLRVICASQVGTPGTPSRYYLWRERGIETVLRTWIDEGAKNITVAGNKDYRSPVTEEVFSVILEDAHLGWTRHVLEGEKTEQYVEELCSLKTDGIIFPSGGLASLLGFRNPAGVDKLLRTQRVGLIDGPIDMVFAKASDAPVDLVTFDWPTVAETIVSDLITLEAFDRNRHTTFDADAHLRVPLSNFSEEFRPTRTGASPV